MRIKRFEARDTQTALAMVKEEMGADAVILATKTIRVRNGHASGNNGRGVEVVAAMDYDLEMLAEGTAGPAPQPGSGIEYGGRSAISRAQPMRADADPARSDREARPTPAASSSASDIAFESHDLRRLLGSRFRRQSDSPPPSSLPGTAAIPARRAEKDRPDPAEVTRWRNQLIGRLEIRPLELDHADRPTVLALVGATGVGKTTTAAKLAAWFSLHEGRRVALLSIDCYRIGATDQLRTYAKIMRLPCEIALREKDLRQAIRRHDDKELIIIDTAGKSPYDHSHVTELATWFEHGGRPIQPHLVLSATSKKEDLRRIIKSYAPLSIAGLILTKLDETRAYATLCQQVAATALPISCLCTGQRVPEDFLPASRAFLEKLFGQGWPAVARDLGTTSEYGPRRQPQTGQLA